MRAGPSHLTFTAVDGTHIHLSVFFPSGKNTVPGNANTHLSNALILSNALVQTPPNRLPPAAAAAAAGTRRTTPTVACSVPPWPRRRGVGTAQRNLEHALLQVDPVDYRNADINPASPTRNRATSRDWHQREQREEDGLRAAIPMCASMVRRSRAGPETNPMRKPAEKTLEETESMRRTRPTGCLAAAVVESSRGIRMGGRDYR
uniref:Uncharacterized protein n=1 Tax=Mycena chlorophos TaxID=658473 RepID=A0ABQ0LR39_MYCCL|nr:predicted protein [Mycena chlorophos]